MNYEALKDETAKAIESPKAGMRFHEMYSYWCYVLAVLPGGGAITRDFGGHPANPPSDKLGYHTFRTPEEFKAHVKYLFYCDMNAFKAIEKERVVSAAELRA
jgi:hypothetical protein